MNRYVFLILFCFSFISANQQVQGKPLQELKKLIKKLGDYDPEQREEAQRKLVRRKRDAKRELKELVNEIQREKRETKDAEVKSRLTAIIGTLKSGRWEALKDAPIEGRYAHTGIIHGNKLIIWGGVGESFKYYNDGAIYDVKKGKWEKMEQSPIAERQLHSAVLAGNKLIIWGGEGGKYHDDGVIYELPILWNY